MSLLRLLTAGKSLVGLKRTEGRYHLPGPKSLPQFGSKKNPFRATVFPERPEPEASPKAEPKPARETDAPANPDGSQVLHQVPESSAPIDAPSAPAIAAVKESKPDLEADNAQPTKSLGLKALFLWRRAKKPRLLSGAGRPLVQGELSLDTVRVVRNDLSESDLEVVRRQPVKSRSRDGDCSAAESVRSSEAVYDEPKEAQLLSVGKL